jgi:hypothetical protein
MKSDSSEIVYFPILRGFSLFDEMIFINFDRSSPCNKKQSALILGTVFNVLLNGQLQIS